MALAVESHLGVHILHIQDDFDESVDAWHRSYSNENPM